MSSDQQTTQLLADIEDIVPAIGSRSKVYELLGEGEIKAVAYSADGKTIATAGTDETARLWDAATLQPIGKPLAHKNWVLCVAISPDGKKVMTGSGDGTAKLWDAETGEARGELKLTAWV